MAINKTHSTDYQQYNKIANLIAGESGNILSPEEAAELSVWLKERPENMELYKRVRNYSRFKEWRIMNDKLNTKKDWETVFSAINEGKRQKFRLSIFRYAAAIILPLMIAGSVYFFVSQPESKKESNTHTVEIKPGGTQAVLILNDGQSIVLDTPDDLLMKERDGTTIQKSKGQLNYTRQNEKQSIDPLFNSIEIPRGGEYNLVLSDGTHVFLNSQSKIRYPVQFSIDSRRVELSGEAYFKVAHSAGWPFIVQTGDMEIEVVGTTFNVNAYENSGRIVTTLVEGQVKVKRVDNQSVTRVLEPHDQAIFTKGKCNFEVKKVDVSLFTAWKNGEFVFQDERLEDIMVVLTRWYSADSFFIDPSVKELRFSGNISRYGDMEPIIEIIQSTGKVKIEIIKGTIILKEI